MRLASRKQMYAEEPSILRETQCGHMNVCQVNVHPSAAMRT